MSADEKITALYTDRYQLAMALAYWKNGRADEPACFDYFFRKIPFGGGFVVSAGLETLLQLLSGLRFTVDDLSYLAREGFPEPFLEELRRFRFRGRIAAAREGEPVFPLEPVLRCEGGLLETQVVETLILNVLNFQSLIATKAARCVRVAGDRAVSEFGLRRAQGPGGLWASRAAAVGGCGSTSNLAAGRLYGIPTAGTMAHSFVQSHDDELSAFRAFADVHGPGAILLLDTYNTLKSGLPNAIRVAKEMEERGVALRGVRLDSGDLAYLARRVREALDAEGLANVSIVASNRLDEHVIRSLDEQKAPIDLFGIGTSLAVGLPDAALDGVYKLCMAGNKPRMKFSETVAKANFPGVKTVSRYRDEDGFFQADAIHLAGEDAPDEMRHPWEPAKRLSLAGMESEPLLHEALVDGERREAPRSTTEIAAYAKERLALLPPEYHRFENPHVYKVGLSPGLESLRNDIHRKMEERIEP
ncbi:MAG: nicotinate phosphoribosyltransferase [Verrucomicrobiales bacterium]